MNSKPVVKLVEPGIHHLIIGKQECYSLMIINSCDKLKLFFSDMASEGSVNWSDESPSSSDNESNDVTNGEPKSRPVEVAMQNTWQEILFNYVSN